MNKTVIISNPDKLPNKSALQNATSYVATMKVFVEKEDATPEIDPGWTDYYFQNKWKVATKSSNNIDPKTQVKIYWGSNGGTKGKVSPELLKAMRNSTKDVTITLNENVIKTNHAAWFESKLITKHRIHGNKRTCWNKNNGSGGHHSHAIDMKSCIAYELLSPLLLDMIEYLKNPKFAGLSPQILNKKQKIIRSIFKIGTISHEEIIEFIEKGLYVQSREHIEGNKEQIAYYKDCMSGLLDWLFWQGYVVVLMDKNGNKAKILDGNESSRAMIQVKNMESLKTIEISYDYWKDLAKQELQCLGNECNRGEEIKDDYCTIGEARNQLINLIHGHKLFTKKDGFIPIMDHPILERRLPTLRMGTEELKIARAETEKHFKVLKLVDDKNKDNSFDFSSTARAIKLDENGNELPNNDLKAYNIRRQEMWDKHKGRFNEENTFTFSGESALEGSIAKAFWQHYTNKPKKKPLPTEALFLLTFPLTDNYEEHPKKTKGTKEAIEFMNSIFSSNIVIERLNPAADEEIMKKLDKRA